jgi:hypothetical protein
MFLDLLDPDPDPDPSGKGTDQGHQAKIVSKTLILLFCDLFLTSKRNTQKNLEKRKFLVGILKVNDENSRIRIQDPDPYPLVRDMDPIPKCHGSATLIIWIL